MTAQHRYKSKPSIEPEILFTLVVSIVLLISAIGYNYILGIYP
jgi:hypothetical protein